MMFAGELTWDMCTEPHICGRQERHGSGADIHCEFGVWIAGTRRRDRNPAQRRDGRLLDPWVPERVWTLAFTMWVLIMLSALC